RQVATPAASIAGWVCSVAFSVSSGPSLTSFQRSYPSTCNASSQSVRTELSAAASAWSIPTDCEPRPGNTKTNDKKDTEGRRSRVGMNNTEEPTARRQLSATNTTTSRPALTPQNQDSTTTG